MNLLIDDFPDTPFEPGRPVSPSNFKGRRNDCIKIIRYLPTLIKNGRPEHFFITGKRGMGKTSFVQFVSSIAEDNFQMIPIHVNNNDSTSVEELILELIKKLSEEFNKGYWGKSFVDGYLKRINEIKLGNLGISFEDNKDLIIDIKNNFSKLLIEICENFENKGIFFVIDDINGLFNNLEFTNWYKSLFESIQFNQYHIPAVFVLVSYPNEFDNLCLINESFSRIFRLIEIDNLENDDIEDFYRFSFENLGYKFNDDESLNAMIHYSWGMPLIMQQIGESVLWNIQNDFLITKDIAINGIIDASIELGNKQIKSKLRKIRSDYYEDILIKLAKHGLMEFKKSDVLEFLNDNEKKVFNGFLQRLKELNIIESIGRENSGEYAFVNRLYFAYFLIKTINNDI